MSKFNVGDLAIVTGIPEGELKRLNGRRVRIVSIWDARRVAEEARAVKRCAPGLLIHPQLEIYDIEYLDGPPEALGLCNGFPHFALSPLGPPEQDHIPEYARAWFSPAKLIVSTARFRQKVRE